MHFSALCKSCYRCKDVCPHNAVLETDSVPKFNRQICNLCKDKPCVDACPNSALKITGEDITPAELFKKIIPYQTFFNNSNGGVTLSGGEPLAQPDFTREFLGLCKANQINCGLETCGYFNWEKVKDFITDFDFIFFDIKCSDEKKHLEFTGLDFNTIKSNLKNLSDNFKNEIIISVPLIPGVNDNETEMNNIADLCNDFNIKKIRLLPYHNFGSSKYEELGLEYSLSHLTSPPTDSVEKFKNILLNKNQQSI